MNTFLQFPYGPSKLRCEPSDKRYSYQRKATEMEPLWTRHTEYRDTGTTVRFDWQKKIVILYEMHSNAHRQEDVLFWRFTYHILYSGSHLVCPFPHSFCVHALYFRVLISLRFCLLFPFLFVGSFHFSFYLFIMTFQPCLCHFLFPFFLLLSHSFISPSLSFISSCFYPSLSFPFSSPVSCILCSFLQLLLPSFLICDSVSHRPTPDLSSTRPVSQLWSLHSDPILSRADGVAPWSNNILLGVTIPTSSSSSAVLKDFTFLYK